MSDISTCYISYKKYIFFTDGIRLKCKYCEQCYTSAAALNAHVRNIHEGVKYQCQYCGKLLTTRNNRALHIRRVHKGQKEPGTPLTPDEFRRKYDKKYCCEYCGKSFSKMYNKKVHVKKIHGG